MSTSKRIEVNRYNFRPRSTINKEDPEPSERDETMPDNIVLTPEQFSQLLNSMKTMLSPPAGSSSSGEPPRPTPGTLAECKSRFSGGKWESVDAFLDAVDVYKGCLNVSDDDALKGMPMLLDGNAAT